jgi:hypothetical protein
MGPAPPVGFALRRFVGEVILITGAPRGDVDPTCAKAKLHPDNTMVVVMKIKLRIGTLCV